MYARGLIEKVETTVGKELGRKYFHRSIKYEDGVEIDITKYFSHVKCRIYVPEGKEEFNVGYGYVVYPKLGYDYLYWNSVIHSGMQPPIYDWTTEVWSH